MNVGAEKVVLKSGAEDLTGMHNLKKGMMWATGYTNKGDEEFIERNHKDIKVVKYIFNQKHPSENALVKGKYVRVVVEEGKNQAAKKKRRPKRSKKSKKSKKSKRSKVSKKRRSRKASKRSKRR